LAIVSATYQERQINQSFTRVFGLLRGRVLSVAFRELPFTRNQTDSRSFDTRKAKPVPAFQRFQRKHDRVANSCVQMKSGEDSGRHSRFHMEPRTTVWRSFDIQTLPAQF
jgi:hypothetical protein